MRRWIMPLLLAVYCVAILLLLDFAYSNLLYTDTGDLLRVPDATRHHALTRNFDGFDQWFGLYRVRTNSLGFKDAIVRDVPPSTGNRRIVLIGDSFTEGIGLPFEDTFAGLLDQAGRARSEKIEFLNGGSASYSPILYYLQVKALIDQGIRFDEVIVFSDISDVPDEATRYFCVDPDPRYGRLCNAAEPPGDRETNSRRSWLQRNFVVIDRSVKLLRILARSFRPASEPDRQDFVQQFASHPAMRWTVWKEGDPPILEPLGVEGGIDRSVQNMQRLADLLASHNISLTIVVYPWVTQLAIDDRDSRQVAIWRDFCAKNCTAFVDLFQVFFAETSAHADWYRRLFIPGDFHLSREGNRVFFRALWKRLFEQMHADLTLLRPGLEECARGADACG